MNNLMIAKQKLLSGDFTCAAHNKNILYTSLEQGIKPVIFWLRENPELLSGAAVADKVVGKAAALLLCFAKVKSVYAGVISNPALQVFQTEGVYFEYGKIVPRIENRTKTGFCPMETKAIDIFSPKAAFEIFNQIVK